jgi:APA family basic amino acid/polyamine antiporter
LTEWNVVGDYTCSPLSMLLVYFMSVILLRGAKDSSRFNNVMTVLNIAVLLLVVLAGISTRSVRIDNLTPFAPHGVPSVLAGAGLVFFAFIGFDMVASLSEEVINPIRNMPLGIVGSLLVCTALYVGVSLAVVGMAPVSLLGQSVPVVNALRANACCTHEDQLTLPNATEVCLQACNGEQAIKPALLIVSRVIAVGASLGLTAGSFTSLMGQPRILYRMAQDGLWFSVFGHVDSVTHVPTAGILLTGVATALLACFVPLAALANLISLGTLMVFTFVNAGVILLRTQQDADTMDEEHEKSRLSVGQLLSIFTLTLTGASFLIAHSAVWRPLPLVLLLAVAIISAVLVSRSIGSSPSALPALQPHSFQCPCVPLVPLAGIACNAFMMGSLPVSAWLFCFVWLTGGVTFYLAYGIHHSVLSQKRRDEIIPEQTPLLGRIVPDRAVPVARRVHENTIDVSIHSLPKP